MRGVHGTISVALLATTLAVFLRVSMANPRLSLQCKNIARDVILNSCKGPRIKRSTENENLEKMNENLPKLTKPDVTVQRDDEPRAKPEKRQFFVDTGLHPIRYEHDFKSDVFHQSELSIPGLITKEDTYEKVIDVTYRPDRYLGWFPRSMIIPATYEPTGLLLKPVVDSDDLLGFHLSSEELDELHEEVGDRLARNSKDVNKKIFQHVATKCCPNAKLCYDNPSMIPCMGY
ncbi:hypothetical protein WH47_10737 [Habropoda laboriosa]|uniref:Uncharacterized protein n=1 Tax=Habropoda laboriosa TaxID=597456 RepID=A0A0L7RBZ4_9HYME|nr:hypothetical protein WH47_10737 [Habropoda laboriosa]